MTELNVSRVAVDGVTVWISREELEATLDAFGDPANAGEILAYIDRQQAEIEQLKPDADRYQWLRTLHWTDNKLGVVLRPKDNVVLGSFIPSLSLLDDVIDTMMKVPS